MGALHEGHLSLIRAARAENDFVVMSIFVNPLQFGPSEDFAAYPRDEDKDLSLAEREGADLAFLPPQEEMYAPDRSTSVSETRVSQVLEGAARPGHFEGVCTVVAKLFNQVDAERAYFGQKDAQQVAVLKRMVRDLSFRTHIIVCPIVRESDGLAMSSRNAYLDAVQRERATVLHRSLLAGEAKLTSGGTPSEAEIVMMSTLQEVPEVQVDYAAAVDPHTFEEPQGEETLLAVAARVGPARLIDNLLVSRERI
jgi:pantoate--beta-alanine ligase